MSNINWSIIIPLYNQQDMAPWHVKFYNALSTLRDDFEVIFSDDGSNDNTRNYFEKGSAKMLFPCDYTWEEDRGFTVAHAKNRAIRRAKGKNLLIIDGDTFIDNNTLRAYDRLDMKDDTVYFGKRYVIKLKDLDKGLHYGFPTIVENKQDFRGFLQDIPPAPFHVFSGANFVIPNKLAKELEYAPDDWNTYGLEDYWMCINYLIHGKKFQAVNDSIAYHCETPARLGHPKSVERLNNYIREHEAELQQLGGVRYF